mgnify:CR=1 FL=1
MQNVYILEQGSYLRKNGDCLTMHKDGRRVQDIPLKDMNQLVLCGYASLSGAVIDVLVRNRVETVFVDPRGRFKGRLFVDEHKYVQRRQNQYLKLSRSDFALNTAACIVRAKLANQARMLQRVFSGEVAASSSLALRKISGQAEKVGEMEVLRGMEGTGARMYFSCWSGHLQKTDFIFNGRNKRPPLDPVNAVLSFVYTLLTNEVLSAIKIVGLDPYLGSLHEIAYGRPSLACDLVEEWRTYIADRFVLGLFRRRVLKPDDFVYRDIHDLDFVDEKDLKNKRPVEMKPAVCRALVQAYEKWMRREVKLFGADGKKCSMRTAVRHQVRHFEKYILGESEEYRPFYMSRVY